MPDARSQARLLISASIFFLAASLYLRVVLAFQDWIRVLLGEYQLWVIIPATVMAPFLAMGVAHRFGASRLITTLLAAAAGGLAAVLLTRFGGAIWGFLVGIVACYPKSYLARGIQRVGVLLLVGVVGFLGVTLSRRLYIDGSIFRWGSILLLLLFVAFQIWLVRLPFPYWMQRESPTNSAIKAAGIGGQLFIGMILFPLAWFFGWHFELDRRIRAIEADGGRVIWQKNAPVVVLGDSLSKGELKVADVQVFADALSLDAGTLRSIFFGPPVDQVRLRSLTRRDLGTLATLNSIKYLDFGGETITDAQLARLPVLPDVKILDLDGTNVTGEFLAANKLPGLTTVWVHSSPFSDKGLSHLVDAGRLQELRLLNTTVTPRGLIGLKRLPRWPRLYTDIQIPMDNPLLLEALNSEDSAARMWVVSVVTQSGCPADEKAPIIRKLLRDKNLRVRQSAYSAFTNHRMEGVAYFLIEMLDDADPAIRTWAVERLAESGTEAEPAVPRLIKLLDGPATRRLAADALVAIGTEDAFVAALPVFLQLAVDQDKNVRNDAIRLLPNIDCSTDVRVAALLKALDDRDPNVRIGAIAALGAIGPRAKRAVPELAALLKDPPKSPPHQDPHELSIRVCAIQALGGIGPVAQPTVPHLMSLLHDPRYEWAVATSLVQIGTLEAAAAAYPVLLKYMGDERFSVRSTARMSVEAARRIKEAADLRSNSPEQLIQRAWTATLEAIHNAEAASTE